MQLYSLRLTNSKLDELKQAVQSLLKVDSIKVHVAGYEQRSIKRGKDVTPHVHVLLEMGYEKIWLNRKANQLGYKGGHGERSYNATKSKYDLEVALQYHCKGDMKGQYNVEVIDEVEAQRNHIAWHTEHAQVLMARTEKVPLYLRVVQEIVANVDEYTGRRMEDGTMKLNKEKIVRRIISAYAEADTWFKSDNLEKTYNLLVAKLDVDSILNSNQAFMERFPDICIDGTKR